MENISIKTYLEKFDNGYKETKMDPKRPKLNISKNATIKEIEKSIDTIIDYVKTQSIGEWVHYPLTPITKLSRKYSEEELEQKLDVWFCNGLNHEIDKIQLIYSSYDGMIGIIPIEENSEHHHDSFINQDKMMDLIDEGKSKEVIKVVYKLWQQLIKM